MSGPTNHYPYVESLAQLAEPAVAPLPDNLYRNDNLFTGERSQKAMQNSNLFHIFEHVIEPVYPGVCWELVDIATYLDDENPGQQPPLPSSSLLEVVFRYFDDYMVDTHGITLLLKTEATISFGRLAVVTARELAGLPLIDSTPESLDRPA